MKTLRLFCCFCLLLMSLVVFCVPGIVLAQDEKPEPVLISEEAPPKILEKIDLNPLYPRIEAIAGSDFVFEVEFMYIGEGPREFKLRTTKPEGWEVYMTPPYEKDKKVSAIMLKPGFSFGDKLRVVVTAPFWPLPEPGEYAITVEAVAGELLATTELAAMITARYSLITVPSLERYNTAATAGEESIFSIAVQNLSTAAIENVTFSSTKPEGWSIEFSPDKIETIEAIDEQTVEISINPPPETIAGDYMISLRASGKQASATEMAVRVTVESPTIWGWVGIVIILIVIAGLVVIFMRFSRR